MLTVKSSYISNNLYIVSPILERSEGMVGAWSMSTTRHAMIIVILYHSTLLLLLAIMQTNLESTEISTPEEISVFNDAILPRDFHSFIQDAYNSKNFALLNSVPYPSEEYPLSQEDATFFWSLAYGQEWCPEGWGGYIDTIGNDDIDSLLGWSAILFKGDNPKVFECERVKEFLERHHIDETLEEAIRCSSLSFALYLGKKYGPEWLRSRLGKSASYRFHTYDVIFDGTGFYDYHENNPILSRVYNLFLDNGEELDLDIIHFRDVPMLDEKYLQPLLDRGFKKTPCPVEYDSYSEEDLEYYGTTKTGIKFLGKILRGEYKVDGVPLELTAEHLLTIRPVALDVETFKLIDERLAFLSKEKQLEFREKCERYGSPNRNAKF